MSHWVPPPPMTNLYNACSAASVSMRSLNWMSQGRLPFKSSRYGRLVSLVDVEFAREQKRRPRRTGQVPKLRLTVDMMLRVRIDVDHDDITIDAATKRVERAIKVTIQKRYPSVAVSVTAARIE